MMLRPRPVDILLGSRRWRAATACARRRRAVLLGSEWWYLAGTARAPAAAGARPRQQGLAVTECSKRATGSSARRNSKLKPAWYGLTREIGWLNREIGPKTVRAHNKSCPAALWDGPACRCSNFFGGNFVAAPDIAQNSAAPARVEFCPIPGAAHARAASATSTPCPPTLPSRPTCCDDRLCTCARAATDAN